MSSKLPKLINICIEKNIPFVSFRLPDKQDIDTWIQLSGKFNFVERFSEIADQSGFVYAPFHRKTNYPIVFFEPELIIENDNFDETQLNEISAKEPLYPEYKYELPFEIKNQKYLNQAEKFIDSFDNEFSKAVLSRVHIEDKPENFDTGEFFIDLQTNYPKAFCHLINIPGAGTWAGATPETLLRINEKSAQTISLAGTQSIGENEINWQKKELEEQQIVTDYIEDILKNFKIQNFKKENIQNLQAGNVVHLATKFSFDQATIEKQMGVFISELHPTPAVCGLPKEKALDLIFETEKHNREYYSGFCGTINIHDKTDLFVNIRCLKILKDKLALIVGGGLTKQSIPEKEWKETILKAETLLSIL